MVSNIVNMTMTLWWWWWWRLSLFTFQLLYYAIYRFTSGTPHTWYTFHPVIHSFIQFMMNIITSSIIWSKICVETDSKLRIIWCMYLNKQEQHVIFLPFPRKHRYLFSLFIFFRLDYDVLVSWILCDRNSTQWDINYL